jgi:hypothetical protein
MTSHDIDRIRLTMQVRWDGPRERRLFVGALDLSSRRARRVRALQSLALAAVATLAFRALPRAAFPDATGARSTSPALESAREMPAMIPVGSTDEGDRRRGLGGFAGADGRGGGARGAGCGNGGSAGTS